MEALIARMAAELAIDDAAWGAVRTTRIDLAPQARLDQLLAGVTIAVARDAAFAFLYPANLATLSGMGATLAWFSPLADEPVPAAAQAVYLPGGYPELHAETLSNAQRWQASIRAAHAAGMPIVAECGGMMALAGSLSSWPMAGLLPGAVVMQERLAGIGPQGLETPQGVLRGHTFHYSTLTTSEIPAAHTVKHPGGATGEAVYRVGSLTASYFHAWFPSCPPAVAAMFSRSAS